VPGKNPLHDFAFALFDFGEKMVCSLHPAEGVKAALQEILHRYRAIKRWADGRRVYDLTRQLFPSVVPVTAMALDRARELLDRDARIMARDALHAAVVLLNGFDGICSWDRDFDRIPGVRRLDPGKAGR